jgi:hypothetical protein
MYGNPRPTEADAPSLNSCRCVRAVARHNHTSTMCGSSSGGRFNWIKPGYRLRKRFRTSLSDLELIDSLLDL